MSNNRVQSSIQKALEMLDCFTTKSPLLTLEDIMQKIQLPKTTVFRTLTQLEDYGYVKKEIVNGKSHYSLGYAFLEKGQLVKNTIDIRTLSREQMVYIRNETNLTVQLAVREKEEAIYIEQFESWRPIRLYPNVGKKAPLYVAACPRVLLAYMDEKEQGYLLEKFEYKSITKTTPTNPLHIQELLKEIRENGYSISKGELFEGTIAIAVPIFNNLTNDVIASLSVIGIESDFDKNLSRYIDLLKEAAFQIAQKII
ncbi:IclR family transcriptional regulator [uncultured Psychrobacillus sp.]|uniref:IclR family transcriptional regulator n=1 Tax=uncultured Psychrobacillus sp. TaxID=1551585 RepID=UPI002638EC32|nr:IclR family transcriptional regulator [uncultured Psychrobacillus sp.]